jgi:hypothetical protein
VTAGERPEPGNLALRDLMRHAMAQAEPPIGPVLGHVVVSARRVRRQRFLTSLAAVAVLVPGLVLAASALGAPGHGRPGLAEATFVRPALAAGDYLPVRRISSASVAQLLLAELPPGSVHSQVQARVGPKAGGSLSRTATASLAEVRTGTGTGSVQLSMVRASAAQAMPGCPPSPDQCRTYTLAQGVTVVEAYASLRPSAGRMHGLSFDVQVLRPGAVLVSLRETGRVSGSRASRGLPLSAQQLVTAALDPRWQFWVAVAAGGEGGGRSMMN